MTTLNENTPAAGQGNEGTESFGERSTDNLTSTAIKPRRRRRLAKHYILNEDQVLAGMDDMYRALCGHTFPVRYGTPSRVASPEERAEWLPCPQCQEMHRHSADMRRDQRALALGLKMLQLLEEKGVDL